MLYNYVKIKFNKVGHERFVSFLLGNCDCLYQYALMDIESMIGKGTASRLQNITKYLPKFRDRQIYFNLMLGHLLCVGHLKCSQVRHNDSNSFNFKIYGYPFTFSKSQIQLTTHRFCFGWVLNKKSSVNKISLIDLSKLT